MGCHRKLLLSFMVGGLMLFYGTTVATALTPQEIGRISRGSTVLLEINDAKGNHSTGSGFVIHDDKIATNYHVVEDMLSGTARLAEKAKKYRVKILVVDKMRDLAIVTATGIDAPALPLGNSDTVQQGDTVYVMGNPWGLVATLSPGIISAIRPTGTYLTTFRLLGSDPLDWHAPCKLLQMTAPTSKGSSGGPVLNESGEVIGIVFGGVPSVLEPDLTVTTPENLNFAIAVNYLKQLAKGEGIPITPISPKISPIMKHVPPSRVSVGDTIPLTLDLISSKAPRQVTIVYKTYDKDDNELEQHNQEMRLGNKQPASSTRIYRVDLPPQKRVGSIKYYIEVEYNNRVAFRYPRDQSRHYRIPIVDDKRPIISVLYPPEDASFTVNEQITFRAEVMDNSVVEEVHIYVLSPNDQSRKLSEEGSSDMYTMDISFSQVGTVEYYLTATDEAENESKSESRHIDISLEPVDSPKPESPKPGPRPVMLDKGIKLYEQARYNEAIEVLNSVIQEIENPIHQAEAYLYLGGSKRGLGASNDKVKEEFQKAIRHNPNQELPPRVGEDHPIFAELIEEVRKELTGELTVISLLPQTEIWIHGTGTDRKMLGTKRVTSRLLRGSYIVEEIYTGGFQRRKKTVTIEPDRHEVLYLGPNVEHDSPSSISVGETIPLTLDLISTKGPQQVKIYYKTYDKNHNKLEQNNQGIRLWDQQSASSTWIYKVGLLPQKRIGSIEYYIEIEYNNHVAFRYPRDQSRYYQISIVDDKPPTISVLDPPEGARFIVNQQITVRAEVIDNSVVKEVLVHFSLGNSQIMSEEGSSGLYAIEDIELSRAGFVEYYLTATDEAGNESQSESRQIDIRLEPPPEPTGDNVESGQSDDPTESGRPEGPDTPSIPEDKSPTINLLHPLEGAQFTTNQQITIRAEVTDDTAVKEVLVHFSSGNSQKLFEEGSSGMYATDILFSRAGSVEYYLTATDEAGNKSQSESKQIKIEESVVDPPPPPPPTYPIYQGIWASVAADNASISGSEGSYMLRLAYLREGKTHPTLGAQLDFSPDRTNMSAMFQWGPALGESDVAFTLLGGIAAYEDSPRSTHITPILGAGLRFYPRDKIVIDATSSIQFRQGFDTISLYHYEVGIRFYITRELGLRAGYGKLSLGDEDVTTLQIGLGYTF